MHSYNKGEWSELYVFFKLLAEGKLFAADVNYNKIRDVFYSILAILRQDKDGSFEYIRNGVIKIVDQANDETIATFQIEDFIDYAEKLYESIKTGEGTFQINWVENLLGQLKIDNIKAQSAEKVDITIRILDSQSKMTANLGFSIKSSVGSLSTLFNASRSTNFIYEIIAPKNYDPIIVNSLDDCNTYAKKLRKLVDNNCELKFLRLENDTFKKNLMMIDSLLPQLLSEVVLYYYSGKSKSKMTSLLKTLNAEDPLEFGVTDDHPIYEYKLKAMLSVMAMGMTAATAWNGKYKVAGGFIIVKKDGDIVCYHVYNKNEFEEFLLYHSKLDTPKTDRHGFGEVYEESGRYYLKLNLQIRYRI